MEKTLSPSMHKRILQFQREEIESRILYEYLAGRQKNETNKDVFLQIAKAEHEHYETLKSYTGQNIAPNRFRITFYKILTWILGYTFTIKFFEQMEKFGINKLRSITKIIPEARKIISEEKEHKKSLIVMIDEERLHYVGSVVLGLNDALVGLTGAIVGLTFALENTKLVALSAIIMGLSATMSMTASNYLAERADGNTKAVQSGLATGLAYLITLTLLVLPYLLVPSHMYITALIIMFAVAALVIFSFNYYTSVAQDLPFMRRFGEMAVISSSVTVLSFVIGLAAKALLGIDV